MMSIFRKAYLIVVFCLFSAIYAQPSSVYANDLAVLVNQGSYATVHPGASVTIWFNVRNSGTNTWKGIDGYRWRGTGMWSKGVGPWSSPGVLWKDIPPGKIFELGYEQVVPHTPGIYTYGFVLEHNNKPIGPHFFVQITVRSYIDLILEPNTKPSPWRTDCREASVAACLPAMLTVSDLPRDWQLYAKNAAETWNNSQSNFHFIQANIHDDMRVIRANIRATNGTVVDSGIRLAIGEVRIVRKSDLNSFLYLGEGTIAQAWPFTDERGLVVAGLIVLADTPDVGFYGFDGQPKKLKIDLQSLITHELGHIMGLDHTSSFSCFLNLEYCPIMYSFETDPRIYFDNRGFLARILKDEDFNALYQLYGNKTRSLTRPVLDNPKRYTVISENTVNFNWHPVDGADRYFIQISDTISFNGVIINTSSKNTSFTTPITNIYSSTTESNNVGSRAYYWRIKASNGAFNSEWSYTWLLRLGSTDCTMLGDSNCDWKANLSDFEIFRQEYIGEAKTLSSDFNHDGKINLVDLEIWRAAYNGEIKINDSLSNQYDSGPARHTETPSYHPIQPISVWFNKNQLSVKKSDELSLDVMLNASPGDLISGTSLQISYENRFLDLVTADKSSEICSQTSRLWTNSPRFSVDVAKGIITISRSTSQGKDALPRQDFCIGTLTFHPKGDIQPGTTSKITMITSASWEGTGPQIEFRPQLDARSSATITIDPTIRLPLVVKQNVTVHPEPTPRPPSDIIPAPLLQFPPDGSLFDHYPRTTTLAWQRVEGADHYRLEIDIYVKSNEEWWKNIKGVSFYGVQDIYDSSFTFDFVGSQPGRWRVWAVGNDGRESQVSDWWNFEYQR